MKKLFLVGALIFGTVAASQAGVSWSVGVGVPLGGAVVSQPAPYYAPTPVYYAPPVTYTYAAPQPYYYAAPRVYYPPVTVSPPSLYFGFGPFWGGHGHDHGHWSGHSGYAYHHR